MVTSRHSGLCIGIIAMSSYLFIAGGFVDSLVEKTKNVFAMDLDPLHYAAMRSQHGRAFIMTPFRQKKQVKISPATNRK
jgi:hypothetical protein